MSYTFEFIVVVSFLFVVVVVCGGGGGEGGPFRMVLCVGCFGGTALRVYTISYLG